ncbi:hypothetical protein LSH36_385g02042 [Paralvinella palmiformis]|uniref:Kazal-like domain-containing protein n=1 Tax=Paralvinella palmiformis TaxID=53620 RepID=A0AAD9JCY8_9ANNE|nr:hypothetical protein LSH36_385g02042 [Paralvinella palmiformis]
MFTCGVFRRLFTNRFDQRQLVFVTFYGEIKRNSSILCSEVRHAASLVLGGGDPTPRANRQTTTQTTNSSLCWSETVCKNSKEKPVCGTDGQTYISKCELKKARRCEGHKVRIRSLGRCSSSARGKSDKD